MIERINDSTNRSTHQCVNLRPTQSISIRQPINRRRNQSTNYSLNAIGEEISAFISESVNEPVTAERIGDISPSRLAISDMGESTHDRKPTLLPDESISRIRHILAYRGVSRGPLGSGRHSAGGAHHPQHPTQRGNAKDAKPP